MKDKLTEESLVRSLQAVRMLLQGKDESDIPIQALNALYKLGDWMDRYRSKMEQKRRRDWPAEYKKER